MRIMYLHALNVENYLLKLETSVISNIIEIINFINQPKIKI